jgi:amino acid adenylation domain-containing protein
MSKTPQLSEAKRELLERYLRSGVPAAAPAVLPIVCRPAPGEPAPLSFAQEQVWLHRQMESAIPFYNQTMTVHRRGPLDVAALERCLVEIIRRHEVWRTTFEATDGEPVQIVHPAPHTSPLRVMDLSKLPEAQREAEAVRLATEDARRPFDLRAGPLLRALLVSMDDRWHRLYMTLDHLIFDAVTAYRVFLPELTTLYEAFSTGKPSPLPDLRIQYADFTYWQRKTRSPEIGSEHLAYWRKQMAGEPPPCQWPNDYPRPPIETHRGAVQRFALPRSLVQGLRALSQEAGVSLYMTLLAAFIAVLHRYTGEDDIVVGGLSAGRNRAELEPLMGYFVTPLALRVDLSGNPTFRELQRRVRCVVLDGLAHEDVPFAHIVRETRLRPDPSRNPLFQFVFSQQPQWPHIAPGWDLVTEEVSVGGSITDLILVVDDRGDRISGPITYNPDLFDASTIVRMVGHWQTLLEGAAANPGRRLSELPLLTEAERHKLLVEWNGTTVEYPRHRCAHEWFEAQVERAPNVIALECGQERLAYRELNQRANRLARHLAALGVGPEALVGICLERPLETIVALLGVLKAGGAYIPLDPADPRVAFLLADSRPAIVLTRSSLAEKLRSQPVQLICLDSDDSAIARESDANLATHVGPGNLAYVIYTSGSTGHPKGTLISHSNVTHSTAARTAYYKDPGQKFLLLSPLTFDSSVAGVFGTLCMGGTLVLPTEDARRDPGQLIDTMKRHEVSHLLAVPSLYGAMLSSEAMWRQQSLRVAIVAGESCPPELVARHASRLPGVRLFNEYGPTEATVWSTVVECTPKPGQIRVPIGRPIANTQVYLLDANLQPVPAGVSGELYIGGGGVARGYLNRPQLTAEKFIPNPFSREPDSRLYKTGDLARYNRDGALEFLGRLDGQVKIRGFRIEPGEIEMALGQHPAVQSAVVVAREDTPGDRRLTAYVVKTDPRIVSDDLRSLLRQNLPEYMLPSQFIFLDALPLTPNGKVDRRRLPAPQPRDLKPRADFVAPRNKLEAQLAGIWETVFGIQPIGAKQNFFELGGHSLLAAKLFSAIEKAFGMRLPMVAIFRAPTIEELGELLSGEEGPAPWSAVVPIQSGGSKPPFFCVHAGGGEVLFYRDFATLLGLDQPVFALQARGLDGRLPPHQSIEEMAADYIKELRAIQPQGPYFLGGHCLGCIIAFEMAQQLTEQGQKVAFLAMMDGPGPRTNKSLGYYLRYLKRVLQRDPIKLVYVPVHITVDIVKQARSLIHQAASTREPAEPEHLLRVRSALTEAFSNYTPRVYPGRITYFMNSERAKIPYERWCEFAAGGFDLYTFPANPRTAFTVRTLPFLAAKVRACLQEAQQMSHPIA